MFSGGNFRLFQSRTTSEQQRRPRRPRLTLEERQKKDQERLDKYTEEQKTKKVLETGCKGTIKWYSLRNKYGFIGRSEQDKGDVFVHQVNLNKRREINARRLAASSCASLSNKYISPKTEKK